MNIGRRRVSAGRSLVAVLALVVAACSSAASPGPSSLGPTASAVLPPGFPVGTWSATLTADDLRAEGITDPKLVRENTGRFVRTIGADGVWTVVQQSSELVTWPVFRGTIRATAANEYEEVTTFPPDYAGEVVHFRWRLESDLLHLTVLDPPDPILPILTETHPWQRS